MLSRPQVLQNAKAFEWGNIYKDHLVLWTLTVSHVVAVSVVATYSSCLSVHTTSLWPGAAQLLLLLRLSPPLPPVVVCVVCMLCHVVMCGELSVTCCSVFSVDFDVCACAFRLVITGSTTV